jgi:Putative transposase DNA-binding domain
VRRFDVIGIENLNVHGMMTNHCLALAVADIGAFEFRWQPEYKAAMSGARIVVADRWYPSSKTRGDCGYMHTGLTLSDREWSCDGRGAIHDRDHNAAINLMNMAGSSSATACGVIRSGVGLVTRTKRIAVKQEPTHGLFIHMQESGSPRARSDAGAKRGSRAPPRQPAMQAQIVAAYPQRIIRGTVPPRLTRGKALAAWSS